MPLEWSFLLCTLKSRTQHQPTLGYNPPQKASTKATPSQDADTTHLEPSYAEIKSFEVKLVVFYSKDGTEYHQSTDLEGNMRNF